MLTRRQFLAQTAAAGSVVGLIASGLRLPARAQTPSQVLTGALAGFFVPPGQLWELTGEVVLTADATVEGTLRARAGTKVLTDGPQRHIWVKHGGVLDFQGSAKAGWNRVGDDPTWQPTDEILMSPYLRDSYASFVPFIKGSPVPRAYSEVPPSEVLNLTRDLTLVGVQLRFMEGAGPQTLRHLAVIDAGDSAVLGEYPIHFHLNHDTTRGSLVEGVVVRGGRHHAFVPHASHGITFRDCIAYQTIDHAYWWDPPPAEHDISNNSVDVTYEHCLAAGVLGNPATNQKNVSGFWLSGGVNVRAIDCTAVGVLGDKNASGFEWPSQLNHEPENVWVFQDNVSHNNFRQGIFIWQNDDNDHVVERTTIYHAGDHGVNWGAYSNPYVFRDGLITACGASPVAQHVTGQPSDRGQLPRWERFTFDASGADHCLEIVRTHVESEAKVLYLDCIFAGQLASAVSVNNDNTLGVWQEIDFVNTGPGTDLRPEDFELGAIAPGTIIRIQRADGSADQMDDQGRWTTIASFHQANSPAPPVTTSTTTSPSTTTAAPGSSTTLAADEHGQLQGLVDEAQDALAARKLGSLRRALNELEKVLETHAGS